MDVRHSFSQCLGDFKMAKEKLARRSLTRDMFLKELVVKPVEVEVNGVVIYVKPATELQRSKRAAATFDNDGNLNTKYLEKRRVLSLIDHLCDKDGEPLFTEKDTKELQSLDSFQIDPYFLAIEKAMGEDEGNE